MILPQVDQLLVQYDVVFRLMRFQWLDATRLHVRPALRHGRTLMREHRPTHVLVDMRGMPDLSIEDQLWMTVNWLPVVTSYGLRQVALVLPPTLHNQMAIEALLWAGRHLLRFDLQFFPDELSALDWLLNGAPALAALQEEWQHAYATSQALAAHNLVLSSSSATCLLPPLPKNA